MVIVLTWTLKSESSQHRTWSTSAMQSSAASVLSWNMTASVEEYWNTSIRETPHTREVREQEMNVSFILSISPDTVISLRYTECVRQGMEECSCGDERERGIPNTPRNAVVDVVPVLETGEAMTGLGFLQEGSHETRGCLQRAWLFVKE